MICRKGFRFETDRFRNELCVRAGVATLTDSLDERTGNLLFDDGTDCAQPPRRHVPPRAPVVSWGREEAAAHPLASPPGGELADPDILWLSETWSGPNLLEVAAESECPGGPVLECMQKTGNHASGTDSSPPSPMVTRHELAEKTISTGTGSRTGDEVSGSRPVMVRSEAAPGPGHAGERDDRYDDPGGLHPQGAIERRRHAVSSASRSAHVASRSASRLALVASSPCPARTVAVTAMVQE